MRRWTLLPTVAFLVVGCTSNSATTTTIEPLPPPPSPTTGGDAPSIPPTPNAESSIPPIEGFLPDGTDYTVYLETPSPESSEAIAGDIVYEIDGQIWWAGEVEFVPEERLSEVEAAGNLYRIPAGRFWAAEIAFSDRFLEFLGEDAESMILDSIAGFDRRNSSTRPFPVLDLTPPFRWSTQYDPTGPMEVRYSTIIVRPGCDDDAAACTEGGTLQVVRRPGYQARGVAIETFTVRLLDDAHFDPGPFPGSVNPDILWTGKEMILWAGSDVAGEVDQQGAAFDPATNTWRTFHGPSDLVGTLSRALWTGAEMMLVSRFETYLGDPVGDTWTEVADGLDDTEPYGPAVVVDGEVHMWPAGGIVKLDIDSGQWVEVPDPGFGVGADRWRGMLHETQGSLVATGLSGEDCGARHTSVLSGSGWTALDTVRFSACSTAYQSAVVGGELILWSNRHDPTYRYSVSFLMWEEDEAFPSGESEGPSGALIMGERALVPSFEESSIYDATTRSWQNVELPGYAGVDQMVWTGTEVLAWVDGRDAWRWTPPE